MLQRFDSINDTLAELVREYVRRHERAYVCACACVCARAFAYTHECRRMLSRLRVVVYVCIHLQVCVHARMAGVHVCVCPWVCLRVSVRVFLLMCKTHTFPLIFRRWYKSQQFNLAGHALRLLKAPTFTI